MAKRPDRKPTPEEMRLIRQVRLAAIVMSLTMVLWVAGQYIGGQLGLIRATRSFSTLRRLLHWSGRSR
jgi:hypothetical protein